MQTTMTKNIALAGHAGSGKTTLCEALLYQSGVTERIGKITEGTIYPLLLRLEKNKWVHATYQASDLGPKRKYYALTPQGEQALTDFLSSYAELSKAIHTLICDIQGGIENEQTNQTTAE